MTSPKAFKKLQAKWYSKLEREGFKDIENTLHEDRPLKVYHNHKFKKLKEIQDIKALYQGKIVDLFNHPSFDEICRSMARHGNSKFKEKHIRTIWEMHIEGLSVRQIEQKLKKSKSCIHEVIKGLRQWIRLIL